MLEPPQDESCVRCLAFVPILLILVTIVFIIHFSTAWVDAEGPATWENTSNITGLSSLKAVAVNTRANTVFVLDGNDIEEWTLEGARKVSEINQEYSWSSKMEWNDDHGWLAMVSLGRLADMEPTSPLVVMDGNGEVLHEFRPWGDLEPYDDASIADLAWRPHSTQLAVLFSDGCLRVYDMMDREPVPSWEFGGTGERMVWAPSGEYFAVMTSELSGKDVYIVAWGPNSTWQVVRSETRVHGICWANDSTRLFILESSEVEEYDLGTSRRSPIMETGFNVAFASPSSPLLALANDAYDVSLWDYQDDLLTKTRFERRLGRLGGWSGDGSYFVLNERETGVLRVWSVGIKLPPPEITILSPAPGNTVSGTVEVVGDVASTYTSGFVVVKVGAGDWVPATGYRQWYFRLDTTQLPDGTVVIRARASDPSGTSEVATTYVNVRNGASVPNEPPEVTVEHPSDGQEVREVTSISGSARDDHRVESVQVKAGVYQWEAIPFEGSGTAVGWSVDIMVADCKGNLTIQVRAFDGLFYSKPAVLNITVLEARYNGLEVTVLHPAEASEVPPSFVCDGTVKNGVPQRVYVQLDYSPLLTAVGTSTWKCTMSGLMVGLHFLSAFAVDDNGITNRSSRNFHVVDVRTNMPPRVGFLDDPNGTTVSADFTLSGWSSDDVLVTRVWLRLNGGEWRIANGTEEWSYDVPAGSLDEGWNKVEVRSSDGELTSDIASTRVFYEPTGGKDVSTPSKDTLYLSLLVVLVIVVAIQAIYIWSSVRKRK